MPGAAEREAMFIQERMDQILKLIKERGRLSIKECCDLLNVSIDTVRRDFKRLSEAGLVLRTHGGAMLKENVGFDPSLNQKGILHHEEKEAIAKRAAQTVQDGETVIIDAGTTALRIVKYLSGRKDLTILTDGLNIAMEATRRGLSTILVGGIVRNSTLCITGPDAVEMIRHYHADKLFLGVSAVSIAKGLMTPNRMEAEIKRALMDIADRVILVIDHSKAEKTSLYSFGPVQDIDMLITDEAADKTFIEELTGLNKEVILVKSEGE